MVILKEGKIELTTGCIPPPAPPPNPPKLPAWEKSLQELCVCVCGSSYPGGGGVCPHQNFINLFQILLCFSILPVSCGGKQQCCSPLLYCEYLCWTTNLLQTCNNVVSFHISGFSLSFPHERLNDLQSPCASVPVCCSPEQRFGCVSQPHRKGQMASQADHEGEMWRRTLKVKKAMAIFPRLINVTNKYSGWVRVMLEWNNCLFEVEIVWVLLLLDPIWICFTPSQLRDSQKCLLSCVITLFLGCPSFQTESSGLVLSYRQSSACHYTGTS